MSAQDTNIAVRSRAKQEPASRPKALGASQHEQEARVSGNIFDLRILRKMLALVRPYRWRFMAVMVLMLAVACISPLKPLLIQYTIDTHLPAKAVEKIWKVVGLLLGLLMLQSMAQYLYLYTAGELGQRVIGDIRKKLYAHVQGLRLRFFDKTPIGRLVTRCVSDVESLLNVFSEGLASILGDLCLLIAILVLMFIMDWRLTLVTLATLPLLLGSTYLFKEKIKSAFNAVRTAVSNLNTFVQEHITGMSIVQIFGGEARAGDAFMRLNALHRRAHMRSVLYYSVYFPIAEIILAASIGLLVWYGAGQVVQAQLSLGKLIAFIMYTHMFFRPIRMIADRFNTLQLGIVSAHRIFALLANKAYVPDEGQRPAQNVRGEVVFEHVSFGYEADRYVLHDVSFRAPAGQVVALVGETGSGKTSTIHLLGRFYEPQQGRILLDGHHVCDYKLSALRRQLGYVMQDVFLFSDTLRNNITLFDNNISDAIIRETAERMGAWARIAALGGLDRVVTERGASLSVGERQLISFLRAMVYDPRVLVLDEATSSVDNQTEELIQKASLTLMKNRTTLVVAHRLSTIQQADIILMFSNGRIQERGTHQSLLKQKGAYHRLYHIQYKEQQTPIAAPNA